MSSRTLFTALAVLALGGCQQGSDAPRDQTGAGTDEYKEDVARICDVLRRSGADQLPEGERMYTTAQWLGDHVKTEAGRDLLVRFQQSADKAGTLRAAAKAAGLPDCALAAEWDGK